MKNQVLNKFCIPKMILFDYGHTLVYETGFDGVKGTEAILKFATKNPNNYSAKEIRFYSEKLIEEIGRYSSHNDIEIHNHNFQKILYESLEIEFSLPPIKREQIFWDNAMQGSLMPNVKEMIDYLNNKEIRTGVISNISFSGEALLERLGRFLPNHKFEFIIASSEYIFRKPHPMIFRLALKKAKLQADTVWYCGDNTKCDVLGAYGVGMVPVWYHSDKECVYRDTSLDHRPDCEHLYINDWLELVDILKEE